MRRWRFCDQLSDKRSLHPSKRAASSDRDVNHSDPGRVGKGNIQEGTPTLTTVVNGITVSPNVDSMMPGRGRGSCLCWKVQRWWLCGTVHIPSSALDRMHVYHPHQGSW